MPTRRNFLQKISVSATALSFTPLSKIYAAKKKRNKSSDAKILRVAIMGLGGYGTRVAEAMQNCTRAKLVGVISGTPSKILAWQKRYHIEPKNCYNYENYYQIKDNPDIDAVYVITPNALHHDAVISIARAGKQVICEKPMCINVQEAKEMIDACRNANVKLLVGYRMHFEPHTLEVIRMRQNGELGKILFFQGLSGFAIGDPGQWRLNKSLSGGGAMMDIGIYSVNGARYMTGEEPLWITAQETKTNPAKFKEGIDETIQFEMGFPGGAVASCLSTYTMNNLDKFFLNGEKDFVEMQPSTGYGPIRARTSGGPLNAPDVVHQAVQMDEMAAIIFDGKKPVVPVDGEEALKDMIIIEAIYKAAATGNKVML
ncbi:MAG TPA: Gfo/Idh/MocA family oxidoreductase [Chitinophagaceae bacterium]|nr:Gfo/Idh/MocA family oxidoreductase [Chitinophagaceae bacterium]